MPGEHCIEHNIGNPDAAEMERLEAEVERLAKKVQDVKDKRIAALEKERDGLREALQRSIRSLGAYLDFAPDNLVEQCYDPWGAIHLANRILAESEASNE